MQKSHFGFWMSVLMFCVLLVTSCSITLSCNASPTTPTPSGPATYTLTWNPEMAGFPNVKLTLTPIIPPKALSLKPSDYVKVSITVGNFTFSTDDPAYQCLETVAATIFAPKDEVISGFAAINDFLIVYQACGRFVQTSSVNLASLGGIAAKELIFFQITGQKIVSRAANGQELTPSGPVGGPTTTPTPTPVVPPTVQILSPRAEASYYIPPPCSPPCSTSLMLSSQASADVISYAWSDTLGLISDSQANDTLTLTSISTKQLGCNALLSDTITLTVTDSHGQTAKASVTIQIERECIT